MNLTKDELEQRNRLKTLLEVKNIDRQTFADAIGRKIGYINQMLSGNRRVTENAVNRLSKRYKDVNPDWIMLGKGDMLTGSQEDDVVSVVSEVSPEYRRTGSLEYDLSVVAHFFEMRILDIDREVARLLREKAELEVQKRGVEEMIEKLRRGE